MKKDRQITAATDAAKQQAPRDLTEAEREILRAVADVTFGSVEVVIHDARVVQVERREKVRFKKDGE
jgi:hypothetical protein